MELKGELGTDLGLEVNAGLEQGCKNVELGSRLGLELEIELQGWVYHISPVLLQTEDYSLHV